MADRARIVSLHNFQLLIDGMTETSMTENEEHIEDDGVLAARRNKLNQISELGHDPWGQRFDDRA